jgi:hypothetical protein
VREWPLKLGQCHGGLDATPVRQFSLASWGVRRGPHRRSRALPRASSLRREGQTVGVGTFLKLGIMVILPALPLAIGAALLFGETHRRTNHARLGRRVALSHYPRRWSVAGLGAADERRVAQLPDKSVARQPGVLPPHHRVACLSGLMPAPPVANVDGTQHDALVGSARRPGRCIRPSSRACCS